jgi:hypothetical protein
LEGNPDDNGRPTLLMITAILGQREWDGEVCGDVGLLLRDNALWDWTPGEPLEAVERSYPAPLSSLSRKSAAKVALLLSEIERRWNAGSPTVVAVSDFSADEFRAVEVLIPPQVRAQFTSAYRALSPQLAATLTCLAAESPLQKITFASNAGGSPSPYATFVLQHGLNEGGIPVGDAMTYRGFGVPTAPQRESLPSGVLPPPPEMPERRSRITIIAAGALLLLVVGVSGFWLGRRYERRAAAVLAHSARAAASHPATAIAANSLSPATAPAVAPAPPPTPTNESGGETSDDLANAAAETANHPIGTSNTVAAVNTSTAGQPNQPEDRARPPSSTGKPAEAPVSIKEGDVQAATTTPAATADASEADAKRAYDELLHAIQNGKLDAKADPPRVRILTAYLGSPIGTKADWAVAAADIASSLQTLLDLCERLQTKLENYPRVDPRDKKSHYDEIQSLRNQVANAVEDVRRKGKANRLVYQPAILLIARADKLAVPTELRT